MSKLTEWSKTYEPQTRGDWIWLILSVGMIAWFLGFITTFSHSVAIGVVLTIIAVIVAFMWTERRCKKEVIKKEEVHD